VPVENAVQVVELQRQIQPSRFGQEIIPGVVARGKQKDAGDEGDKEDISPFE
jgi:hypothetical protein